MTSQWNGIFLHSIFTYWKFFIHWTLFTLTCQVLSCLFVCVPSSIWYTKLRHNYPTFPPTAQSFLVVSRMLIWSKSQKLSSYFSLRAQRDQAMETFTFWWIQWFTEMFLSPDFVIPKKIGGFFVDSEAVDLGRFLCAKKEAVFLFMTLILFLGGA